MENNDIYYCYSFRLFHFLSAFGEKCLSSDINRQSKKRFWTFKKSDRLDEIICLYNEVKHKIN